MDKQNITRSPSLPRVGRWPMRSLAAGSTCALAAFLLGQATLPFGVRPLGIGLLCAAGRQTPWVLIGAAASAFTGERPWVSFAATLFLLAVRVLVRLTLDPPLRDPELPPDRFVDRLLRLATPAGRAALFGESTVLRMATACVGACLLSVWAIVAGGYRYYDLFGAFLAMTAAPISTLLYAPIFDDSPDPRRRDLAVGAMLISLCLAVRTVDLFGISVVVFLAFIFTLLVTQHRGIGPGMLCGLACGLCTGLLCAPIFPIAAGAAGLLSRRSPTAAVITAALLGMLWGGYIEGLTALIRLIPALVCASIFLLSVDRLALSPSADRAADFREAHTALAEQRAESAEAKMRALSDTFSALAQVCSGLSDRLRRPGILALRQLCDRTCDQFCQTCANRTLCWEREYGATIDLLGKLTIALHAGGRVGIEMIPAYLRERCPNVTPILDGINLGCAQLWSDCTEQNRAEGFAADYAALSAILAETLERERAEYAVDEDLSEKVRALARRLGLGVQGIIVYGDRRKQILAGGLDLRRAGIGAEDLRRAFADCCGFPLAAPVLEIQDELVSMRLCTARRFSVEGIRRSAAAGSEPCGDTVVTFESGSCDCYYALISDGMGSGREAALTSRICALFLEKMLSAGNRRETALRLLNSFLRAKGIECSATIDLMELDLITGRAGFIKSGAAPSYVCRDGNLFKLQSKTVPIGIMRALDAEQLCFDVEPGDVIIMISDGIAQSFEESVWLLDLLSAGWDKEDSLTSIADRILSGAAANNARPDDRSVVVLRVS
ncbi:MAG: SpoIIE family protein phosphatase [Clostridia bacterium]|nr:SpoIIE family protein phosphatase [Clostridia bacterium]